jgi:hypothetical protein
MPSKLFQDEIGRIWKVTKGGSSLTVEGKREESEKLIDIARSCALKAGIKHTKTGVPLQYINEHRRIWNTIWDMGKSPI